MQKLELLAPNLIIILSQLVNNQKICKLINYNSEDALNQPDLILPQNNLIKHKVFPFPFPINFQDEECTNIRVYYPKVDFKNNEIVVDEEIFFDIVCANNLWLISGSVRPYEIASEIFNIFRKKSIETLGRMQFIAMYHVHINESYDAVRLVAKIVQYNN